MNLFFRLIVLILRNLFFAKPLDYLEPARLKFTVWITDQDAFQHMNNAVYMSIADLAVIDLLMRTGVARNMRKNGITPVVVHKSCTYLKMLKFPQAYEVASRFTSWDGAYIFFEHRFERNGKLHAKAVTVGRLAGRRGKHPTVQEAMEQLGWENVPESPPLTEDEQRLLTSLREARAKSRDGAAS
ncbi:MAG: acyl-CoA thioesterase [Hyphomonadaceae bacterium]|nr:acyl-CoA thioesterase [Hyphomonadaceae bacterium]